MPHPLALYQEGPVINWNFLQSQSLTSFSRTSNATLFDSTGKLTYAPNNLQPQSNAFTTGWIRTNITLTQGVADPFGGSSAWTYRANANNVELYYNGIPSVVGVNYIASIWMRRRTGSGNVRLLTPNASTTTPLSLTTDWARYYVLATATGTNVYVDVAVSVSGDEIDIYGAQLEAGSFPTSYIPTTSASVQRTADVATLTGTALTTLQGSAGTVVTEFNCSVFPGGYFQLVAIGTAGYAFSYVSAARKGASNPSSTLDIVTANTATAGVDNRVGVSFLSSGAASVSLNGGSAAAGTGASFSPTTVYLGSQSSSNFLDGYIRKLAIWNVKLSDAKLVQKSTVGATF